MDCYNGELLRLTELAWVPILLLMWGWLCVLQIWDYFDGLGDNLLAEELWLSIIEEGS